MSVVVAGHDLAVAIGARHAGSVVSADEGAAWVQPEAVRDVCAFLRDDPAQRFELLSSVTAVDYVEHFDVVYRLTSVSRNATAVLKTRVYGRDGLHVPSVAVVWKGAELQEREVFDLLGIAFDGHPNLKRILTWEGFKGHPLRRDYLEPPLPYTWPHGG